MFSIKSNVTRVLVISIAASVSLVACGGSEKKSKAEKAEEAVREKFGEEGLIEVGIVMRAYEQGRLGTREQVEADMEPFFSPPDYEYKIPKPFDGSGKFIPLSQMTDEQIYALSGWYHGGKVYGILREEFNAAITEYRAKKDAKKD